MLVIVFTNKLIMLSVSGVLLWLCPRAPAAQQTAVTGADAQADDRGEPGEDSRHSNSGSSDMVLQRSGLLSGGARCGGGGRQEGQERLG